MSLSLAILLLVLIALLVFIFSQTYSDYEWKKMFFVAAGFVLVLSAISFAAGYFEAVGPRLVVVP